jgi:chaperone required for assembly of F1-ATPase
VRPEPSGHAVDLDSRPLRTPAGAPLIVPTAALARAIAEEWDALEGTIEPDLLPLTRLANSAIYRVTPAREPVIETIAAYGGSDLLCYRAEAPAQLRALQTDAWDPWLDWSAREFGAPLIAVFGLMPHPQPETSLAALRAAIAVHDGFGLAALHEMVALSGSLVLGLAVSRGVLDAGRAWDLSRLDETWQAEQWGRDDEAESAAARKRRDFLQAEALRRLLVTSS